jgi:hypothetical protein
MRSTDTASSVNPTRRRGGARGAARHGTPPATGPSWRRHRANTSSAMHHRVDVAAVPTAVVADARVRLQHRVQPRAGVTGLVPQPGQTVEVGGDVAVVPGHQNGLDVREVLVERGPPDAGPLGDLCLPCSSTRC